MGSRCLGSNTVLLVLYDGEGNRLVPPARLDELRTNFTNAQAYAISRGAVRALEGQLDYCKYATSLGTCKVADTTFSE